MPDSQALTIRSAMPADVPKIFRLIEALAEYEKLSHEVVGNATTLGEHLFGPKVCIEAILAEWNGDAIAFALFFQNYSVQLLQPGLYLEDLFVMPAYRGQGVGKALLTQLAQTALERHCGQLEWSVLDWNAPAIAFYRRMGADILEQFRVCRVAGEAIAHLAAQPISSRVRSATADDLAELRPLIEAKSAVISTALDPTAPDTSIKNASTKNTFIKDSSLDPLAELRQHLWGDHPTAQIQIAVAEDKVIGCAVFSQNYSTFLTKPGFFVGSVLTAPDQPKLSLQQDLLTVLAQQTIAQNFGRLEWLTEADQDTSVHQGLEATLLPDWRICRVSGPALTQLSQPR